MTLFLSPLPIVCPIITEAALEIPINNIAEIAETTSAICTQADCTVPSFA